MSEQILFLGNWYLTQVIEAQSAVGNYPFVFNLEAPLSKRGSLAPGKINLRMETEYILASFGRKPLAVCLANNHIMDYGTEAFEDTLEVLNRLEIPYYGAGRVQENFNNPLLLEVGGQKLVLMGYVCPSAHPIYAEEDNPGACPTDISHIRNDIETAT